MAQTPCPSWTSTPPSSWCFMGSQVHALSHVMRFTPPNSSASLHCLKQMRYGRLEARNAARPPFQSSEPAFCGKCIHATSSEESRTHKCAAWSVWDCQGRGCAAACVRDMTRHLEGFGIKSPSSLQCQYPIGSEGAGPERCACLLQAAAEKATAKRSAPQHCRKAGGRQSSTIGAVQVCLPPPHPTCASAEQIS